MIWVGVVVITKTACYFSILIQKRFIYLFSLFVKKKNKGN